MSAFYFPSTKYDKIVVTGFVMLGLNLTFLKGILYGYSKIH